MRPRPFLVAVAVPALFACLCPGPGGDQGGPVDTFAGTFDTSIAACVPSDAPEVTLGTGQAAFTPIEGEVAVEYGPQGGQHVWLAFRSTGLDLSGPSVVSLVGDAAGQRVVDQVARLAWTCHDDGTAEVLGLQVPVPADALGERLTLEATITDPEGREVHLTEVFTLRE